MPAPKAFNPLMSPKQHSTATHYANSNPNPAIAVNTNTIRSHTMTKPSVHSLQHQHQTQRSFVPKPSIPRSLTTQMQQHVHAQKSHTKPTNMLYYHHTMATAATTTQTHPRYHPRPAPQQQP